jgi:ADP-ribosylglycohydrolase
MMCTAIRGEDPLPALDSLVAQLPDEVRGEFAEVLASIRRPESEHYSNGTVWGCLAQAVWCLRTTTTFEDAVVAAVSLGDDADNPDLPFAVSDAVAAFLGEGRDVVVHCHGGRSRTGLVLKAWKMRNDGSTEREAHTWLAQQWPRYENYNRSFVHHLQSLEAT